MKRQLFLAGAIALTLIAPANAATTPSIAITALAPSLATNFSSGDQVSGLLSSNSNIFLIGTIETTSSALVTAAPLGGSDGFITALTSQGTHSWDLRLGTAGDDVATAGYLDATGNIWITGASTPTNSAVAGGLNRLTIWEVSPTGLLLNTFTRDFADVNIPTSITLKALNFSIQGISNKPGFPTFALTLTPLGKMGGATARKVAPLPVATSFNAISSAYSWQSLVATKAIKGVTGVHSGANLLLKSSLKDKSIKGAYSVQGSPIAMQFQSGIGVVLLTQGSGTYLLTILHTK